MTAKQTAAPKKAAKPKAPSRAPSEERPDPAAPRPQPVYSPHPVAPESKMVKVKELATGRVFASEPIDARELVTHPLGEHVYAGEHEPLGLTRSQARQAPRTGPASSTPPTEVDRVAPEEPPGPAGALAPASAKAALEDKSKSELQDLATRVGVDSNQSKAELVKALQPHAEAGTLSLSAPASLRGNPPKERA